MFPVSMTKDHSPPYAGLPWLFYTTTNTASIHLHQWAITHPTSSSHASPGSAAHRRYFDHLEDMRTGCTYCTGCFEHIPAGAFSLGGTRKGNQHQLPHTAEGDAVPSGTTGEKAMVLPAPMHQQIPQCHRPQAGQCSRRATLARWPDHREEYKSKRWSCLARSLFIYTPSSNHFLSQEPPSSPWVCSCKSMRIIAKQSNHITGIY